MDSEIDDLIENPDDFVNDAIEISNFECNRNYGELTYNLNRKFYQTTKKDSAVYFYGSRSYKLANQDSNLNIFLDFKNQSNYYADITRKDNADLLNQIKFSLLRDYNWQVKLFAPNANVPFLNVCYISEKINCTITVTNGMDVRISHLLRHLTEIQPEFSSLFFFIRMWLECHNIEFMNYILTLLAIFFLQQGNYMPTIERVQLNLYEKYIDGWNVAFDGQRSLSCYGTRKMRDFKDHIYDFFFFYSKRFDNYVISTHEGHLHLRDDYEYKNFAIDKPLCVAGIFQKDLNCAAYISNNAYKKFVNCCRSATKNLKDKSFQISDD